MKQVDILAIILFPILALSLSFQTHASFLTNAIYYWVIPSIYFSLRNPKAIGRSLIFTFVAMIPFAIPVDYLAVVNHVWFAPGSVFPFRPFGLFPLEDQIWGASMTFYILMFYQYFFDRGSNKLLAKRFKYLLAFIVAIVILFLFKIVANPAPQVSYLYFKAGAIFFLIPTLSFLAKYPKYIHNFAITGAYFSVVCLMNELTGLALGNWYFPENGQFIGWVILLGQQFPFEELFFFIMLIPLTTLTYFTFFDDDKLRVGG